MKSLPILALLLCVQLPALAGQSYTETGSAKTDPYGIGSPEEAVTGSYMTPTRHHRFGEQSGIGSSTAKTTGVTAETMPTFVYRPTSISPAVGQSFVTPSLKPIHFFSESMTSPALSPVLPATQAHIGQELLLPEGGALLSPLSGQSMIFSGHHKARGGNLGRELVNPLEGL